MLIKKKSDIKRLFVFFQIDCELRYNKINMSQIHNLKYRRSPLCFVFRNCFSAVSYT